MSLLSGDYTDVYFIRASNISYLDNCSPNVLYQVFPRGSGILCGINEVIAYLRREFSVNCPIKIHALDDGCIVAENETVMTIEGSFKDIVDLETVYLGILSRMTSIATNMNEIVVAANGRDVIMMSARFERPEMQIHDGYAAYVGGCRKFSTIANCLRLPDESIVPVGTIPHALIAAYEGDTVRALLAFDKYMDQDIPRIALVDFNNDCVKDALACANALGDRLYAVRLDTSKGMVDESIVRAFDEEKMTIPENLRRILSGVCPTLVRHVREALDKGGYGHVKIIVSGGFTAEKIRHFVETEVPFDGVGVGSSLYSKRIDFTSDIVMTDGKPCAKKGREFRWNDKLKEVQI